ncbi:hypothetical protein ORI20_24135 [Mycobacterium sp. CVI_P3]|uniref:Uncharacterized protein n=1 Tax=Mycobacterium pinniadriaticum TaxID=2994102 RepID=A0ABT3SKW4_9MYCO|nr:hypothetical protein [Mycobacterium pinniadriaticum]MCX2933367.1 hypothetical protein [Mycobacterium pinniadriaticum]MCX2939789.1 hypothetical protein [Mycobacterium pinniadriaticum]
MFDPSDPPECLWLPRPYSEEEQADVSRAVEASSVEFVPWASLRRLADGMAGARKSRIRLLATEGDPAEGHPRLAGWAAAVGAKHVLTGAIVSAPPSEIEKTLDKLRMYGNNGWADVKTNVGTMTRTYGQKLADAGCGPDWVVGYFIGQGLLWDSAARLREFLGKNVTR